MSEFQKTEIGLIPTCWAIKSLFDCRLDVSDGNYSSKYPKSQDFRPIGVPFIRANNIHALGVTNRDMRFITATQHAELLKGHLKKNDVLITTRGDIGQVALVPNEHVGSNINAQIVRLNSNGCGIDHRYFAYYLTSSRVQRKIETLETGSALKQLPVGKLMQLPIVIPPPEEQRAIAEALSDVDALINALDALITKKRHIKQGTMQQLLTGKKRLPGFSGDWEKKRIGEIAEVSAGGTPSRSNPNFWDGDIPWITTTQIEFGTIRHASQFITKDGLYNSAARLYPAGTLLMALYGQGKTRGKIGVLGIEAATNQACAAICLRNGSCAEYVLHNLSSRYSEIREMSNSGSQENLNGNIVKNIVLPLPEPNEQTAIAEVLCDMDAEITALEQKRDKTKLIKQGMMQELLTGKTRLI